MFPGPQQGVTHLIDADGNSGRVIPRGVARRIGRLLRPRAVGIAAFAILTILEATIVAANPLLLREVIENGIVPADRDVVIGVSLTICALAVVAVLLGMVGRWLLAVICEDVVARLRSSLFAHLLDTPLSVFRANPTGALTSRMGTDVLAVRQAFTIVASSIFSNCTTVVVTVAAMLVLSWQVTLAAVAIVPVTLLVGRVAAKRLGVVTRKVLDLDSRLQSTVADRFSPGGALLVKLVNAQPREAAAFASEVSTLRALGVRQAILGRAVAVPLLATSSIAVGLVYGLGGLLAIDRVLDVGSVVALAVYLTRLYTPLGALANLNVEVSTAVASFERVFELLDIDAEPAAAPRRGPGSRRAPATDGSAEVAFRHVSFRYPPASESGLVESAQPVGAAEGPAIDGLSFTAPSGAMTAVVGPSGSGKSTIALLLLRLYERGGGTITLGGTDVDTLDHRTLRDAISFVSQDAQLLGGTIRDNLRYGDPDATEAALSDALAAAGLSDYVAALPDGLDTDLGERGEALSGGQRQRLTIARALVRDPRVLVLDEPTSHLDAESEADVRQGLRDASRDRTVIVIAHRLSTVIAADRIVFVDRGRAEEIGTHDELLARHGRYERLFRAQADADSAQRVAEA